MYHKAWFQSPAVFIHSDGTYVSTHVFKRLYTKPLLDKMSAVVGAGNLDESTRQEMKYLFERTAHEVLQYRLRLQLVAQQLEKFPSHPSQTEVNKVSPWAEK